MIIKNVWIMDRDFVDKLAPYGYIKDSKDKHKFLIDKNVSYIIKKIFDMIHERKSRRAVAAFLNQNNRGGYGMNKIIENNEITFESIKHINEYGNEYWSARELQNVLEYKEWRKFEGVITKAKETCINSGFEIEDHFVGADKMVKIGSKTERKVKDYKLSRYACYLIAQNGDSRKKVIALAQTYFAIQTRRQEITEQEYDSLSDDEKRFYQRKLTKQGNYTLQKVASSAGVKNMAEFHNAGYKGLYNGETADDIFKRKKLRYREDILDNMNEDELVANLFRINQTKQKLLKDNIQGETEAKDVHYEVGKKVRKAIADIGGMMPEEMPTPKKSLKELEREKKQLENKERNLKE